jgi:hypothetical protein
VLLLQLAPQNLCASAGCCLPGSRSGLPGPGLQPLHNGARHVWRANARGAVFAAAAMVIARANNF